MASSKANISSSDDDDSSGTDEQDKTLNTSHRQKRGIEWCGVDTEDYSYGYQQKPILTWPPEPSTSSSTPTWTHLRKVKFGNPMFGSKMQLFAQTNYNLAIYPDGSIRGTRDDDDLHTHLQLSSAGYPGHVRIQGMLTKLFVAMNSKGRLYGEVCVQPDITEDGTVFIETLLGSYNVYLSRKFAHLGWYLGIKRSGKPKRGTKTGYRQKAVKFLPRRSKFY